MASFPRLEVLSATALFESDRYHLYKYPNYALEDNKARMDKLAKACPLLERVVFHATQVVLIRDEKIRWVFRKLGDNEAVVREGEKVYNYD